MKCHFDAQSGGEPRLSLSSCCPEVFKWDAPLAEPWILWMENVLHNHGVTASCSSVSEPQNCTFIAQMPKLLLVMVFALNFRWGNCSCLTYFLCGLQPWKIHRAKQGFKEQWVTALIVPPAMWCEMKSSAGVKLNLKGGWFLCIENCEIWTTTVWLEII